MGVIDVWLLLYIAFQVYIIKLTYRAYTMHLEVESSSSYNIYIYIYIYIYISSSSSSSHAESKDSFDSPSIPFNHSSLLAGPLDGI